MNVNSGLTILKDYVRDNLSPDQADLVFCSPGCVVVRACPGAGKTKVVGTRFAYRMLTWDRGTGGIAVASYTNTACEELIEEIERFGFVGNPPYPHYLGTLDSLFLEYLFYPYGHLVMNSGERPPQLVTQFGIEWFDRNQNLKIVGSELKHQYSVTDFHFGKNGSLEWRPKDNEDRRILPPPPLGRALAAKQKMATWGFATNSDSMYWCLQVVRHYPYIAEAVARRFPEIVVDECQDTSAVQQEILERLEATGLCSIMLVGDPDQSIYSFNGARPSYMVDKARQTPQWREVPLTGTWRCSQLICDAAQPFSTLTRPATACGPTKDALYHPMLISYRPQQVNQLVQTFLGLIRRHNLAPRPENSAILTRTWKDARKLLGVTRGGQWKPTRILKLLMRAANFRQVGNFGEAHEAVMDAVLTVCFDRVNYGVGQEVLGTISKYDWKIGTWRLLMDLPSPSLKLEQWIPQCRDIVNITLRSLGWPTTKKPSDNMKVPTKGKEQLVANFADEVQSAGPLTIQTVHQAKGRTYEAVMVVAPTTIRGQGSSLAKWFTTSFTAGVRDEEARIAYVAMTRASQLLVLAIPEAEWNGYSSQFDGFQRTVMTGIVHDSAPLLRRVTPLPEV